MRFRARAARGFFPRLALRSRSEECRHPAARARARGPDPFSPGDPVAMKVSAPFTVVLAGIAALASACAGASRLSPMPAYSIPEADLVDASAPLAAIDDDRDDDA